jgi:hypothetical protein
LGEIPEHRWAALCAVVHELDDLFGEPHGSTLQI